MPTGIGSEVEAISRDDQCPLGKWIYSTGGESFGTIQSFGDMKAMHAHFKLEGTFAGPPLPSFRDTFQAAAKPAVKGKEE